MVLDVLLQELEDVGSKLSELDKTLKIYSFQGMLTKIFLQTNIMKYANLEMSSLSASKI